MARHCVEATTVVSGPNEAAIALTALGLGLRQEIFISRSHWLSFQSATETLFQQF